FAQLASDWLAVDRNLKNTGARSSPQSRRPVNGSHPDAVGASLADLHFRDGIGHRLAETVSVQVGRTHALDKLGVHFPPPFFRELFRFDQNGFPMERQDKKEAD